MLTNLHWFPQCRRLIKRKHSDDFSLWTTVILLGNNLAWWWYAAFIDSPSLLLQQGLTIIMLLFFASLIIRYHTTPLLFENDIGERVWLWWQWVCVGLVFSLAWAWVLIQKPITALRGGGS